MNILITGANGFVGKHLTIYLLSLGLNIYTIGRSPYTGLEKNFYFISAINNNSFKMFLLNANIDYFIHLTGNPNLIDQTQNNFINCDLGLQILKEIEELYRHKSVKCIFFGSAAEYGLYKSHLNPINETQKTNPISNYGIAKNKQTINAIAWAKKNHKMLVIRPFSILGEEMPKQSAFGSFIKQIKNKNSKYVKTSNLDVHRDFIDINDLIKIIWKLVLNHNSYGKIVNVCSGKPIHLKEMLEYMIKYTQTSKSLKQMSNEKFNLIPNIVYGDNSLLFSLIGKYKLLSWKRSLKRILDKC